MRTEHRLARAALLALDELLGEESSAHARAVPAPHARRERPRLGHCRVSQSWDRSDVANPRPAPLHHTPHFPASNLTDTITRFIGLREHVQDSAAVSVLAPRQIPGRDAVTGESIRPWTCSSVMGREWLKHLGQASTAPSPGFTLLRLTLSLHRAASSPWLPPGCPTCSPPCSSRWLLPPPSSSDCGCGTVLA